MAARNRSEELLPGTLDMLILKSLASGPRHGYDVAEYIKQVSEEVLRVEEAALYPALHRLELRGLLAARWGVSENNRRAKFYSLTTRGREYLGRELRRWDRLARAVGRVIETA